MTTTPPEPPADEPDCALTQQTVAWALHALEPDEEMAVLLHLPQCATCRATAHDTEEVLAGLAGLVPLADPPPGLRGRILAEAATTPQRPAVLRPRPDAPAAATGAPAAGSSPRPQRLAAPAPSPRRAWRQGRRLVAAGLAVAAAVAVGVLAVRTGQLEQERDVGTAQAQTLTELVREIGEPGARYALLDDAGGAPLAAIVLADGQRRIYPVALPPNGNDSIYVAWGLTAQQVAVPLGPFDVLAGTGEGPLPVGSGSGAQDFPQYAVSIEPGRVVPGTPSTVVASGQVTS